VAVLTYLPRENHVIGFRGPMNSFDFDISPIVGRVLPVLALSFTTSDCRVAIAMD
jgi:hypothetical protein